MKKAVLILVSAVILTVFIAFNYLLWDRENKIKNFEFINDTKNSSIDTLGAEISSLKDANSQLKDRITELEDFNKGALLKNSELESSKSKADKELAQKKEVINKLQQQADMKVLEEPVRKWVESLDKSQFEAAYNIQYKHSLVNTDNITLSDFTKTYKESVKSIKIKSIKLVTEEMPPDKVGNIIFKTVLEVKKTENSTSNTFNEGTNERYFYIDFDKQSNEWVITDVVPAL